MANFIDAESYKDDNFKIFKIDAPTAVANAELYSKTTASDILYMFLSGNTSDSTKIEDIAKTLFKTR